MKAIHILFALAFALLLAACGTPTYQGPATNAPMVTCYKNGFCVTTRTNTRPSGVYVSPYRYRQPLCRDAYGWAHPCPRPVRSYGYQGQGHHHEHGPGCGHDRTQPSRSGSRPTPQGRPPRRKTSARPAPSRRGVHKTPQARPGSKPARKPATRSKPYRVQQAAPATRTPRSTRPR